MIKSALDEVLERNSSSVVEYINNHESTNNKDSQLDYVYTYLLANHIRYGKLVDSPIGKAYPHILCSTLDTSIESALKEITIPREILAKNSGVNPFAFQRLFDYFQGSKDSPEDLIPPLPENDDALEKYIHIVGRISKYITGDPHQLNYSRGLLVTNWLRGYGLARIISRNVDWYAKNNPEKSLSAIIRETMQEIENYARFSFLKYVSCYIDVLKHYFRSIEQEDYINQIPNLSLWLEFGVSKETQISLMSLGFTRATALEISELMVVENWDKVHCLKWLRETNLEALEFSPLMLKEIRRILDVQ